MSANPPRAPGELAKIEAKLKMIADHGHACASFNSAECAVVLHSLRSATGDGARRCGRLRPKSSGIAKRACMALTGGCKGGATNRAIRDACANMESEIRALQPRSTKIEGAGEL